MSDQMTKDLIRQIAERSAARHEQPLRQRRLQPKFPLPESNQMTSENVARSLYGITAPTPPAAPPMAPEVQQAPPEMPAPPPMLDLGEPVASAGPKRQLITMSPEEAERAKTLAAYEQMNPGHGAEDMQADDAKRADNERRERDNAISDEDFTDAFMPADHLYGEGSKGAPVETTAAKPLLRNYNPAATKREDAAATPEQTDQMMESLTPTMPDAQRRRLAGLVPQR